MQLFLFPLTGQTCTIQTHQEGTGSGGAEVTDKIIDCDPSLIVPKPECGRAQGPYRGSGYRLWDLSLMKMALSKFYLCCDKAIDATSVFKHLFGAARSDRPVAAPPPQARKMFGPILNQRPDHASLTQIDYGEFSGTATIAEVNPVNAIFIREKFAPALEWPSHKRATLPPQTGGPRCNVFVQLYSFL